MKKSIIFIAILLLIIGVSIGIIINENSKHCYDISHIGIYPVNPCCPKCGLRDGVVQHECTNPNGENKYCRVCGKIVSNK